MQFTKANLTLVLTHESKAPEPELFLGPMFQFRRRIACKQGAGLKVSLLIRQVSLKRWRFIYFLTSAQNKAPPNNLRRNGFAGEMQLFKGTSECCVYSFFRLSPLSVSMCKHRQCSPAHREPWSTSIQHSCCPFHGNKGSCYKVIDWFSRRQMGLSTSALPPSLPVESASVWADCASLGDRVAKGDHPLRGILHTGHRL